jgi:hypothetical protein
MLRCLCAFTLVVWLAACNRQHQQPASAAPGGVVTATTPTPPSPVVAPNPTPDRPPVEASVPSDSLGGPSAAPGPAENPVPPAEAYAERSDHASRAVIIPTGTRLRVRLGQTLDTKRSRPGERFVAYLDAPVLAGQRVIIPKGTAFEGRVVEAKPSGRLKGKAYLAVRLDSFRLHGRIYPIATAANFESSRHKKRNLAIIGGSTGTGATVGAVAGGGIGAVVGAGAGAFVGTAGAFITGKKNVRLPVETPLVFSLRGPLAIRG